MYNKAVMIVDDDADILEYLAFLLKRHGLAVLKAQDAESALHLVQSLKPDLFLLDIWMPGINGFELCRQLRANQHTAHTPVIVFSALSTARAQREALAAGADLFLSKSELPTTLIQAIQTLLGQNTPSPVSVVRSRAPGLLSAGD
jgi:CheY-like chemotaxis protein